MTSTTFAATQLLSNQRIDLAIAAMSGTANVSHLASEHQVSRKFVYQQKDKAQLALDAAFALALLNKSKTCHDFRELL